MSKLTVTYAGLPFRQVNSDLADRLSRYMPPDELPDIMQPRFDWPGPNLLALGMPSPPPPAECLGLGCMWYPWGMSRHAVYRGIMTAADVTTLGALVQAAPTAAQSFVVASVEGTTTTTMTTPLHVLPPRPCREDGLYLVTLVDDRWHRMGRFAGKIRPDGTLTWGSLISALATALGITLTSAAVDAAYYKPEPDSPLYSSDESAAVLLDAAAANIGRVVVRDFDGTYRLETYSAGNTAAGASRLKADGTSSPRLWGGAILPTDPTGASNYRPTTVPASVLVTFPKWVTGSGYYEPSAYRQYRKVSYGDVFEKTVTLADISTPYSGWTAGPGKKVIRTTAKAEFADAAAAATGTSPTNASDLTALAQRQAKDFYDSQAAALDETYLGFVKRTPDGACDTLWCLRQGEISTRVTRRPWDYGSSERHHCITAQTIPSSAASAVKTVYAIADLGGSPKTFTVREVARNGAGALVDVAGPIQYTAYEGGDREVKIQAVGTPVQEYPLFADAAGKYYFEIEQYTDGSASPALPGQVSNATQVISGLKKFITDVEVYNNLKVGNTIASPGGIAEFDVVSASAGYFNWGGGYIAPNVISYVTDYTGAAYATSLYGAATIVGGAWIIAPNATPANNSAVAVTSGPDPGFGVPPSGGGQLAYFAQPFYTSIPAFWVWGQRLTWDATTRFIHKIGVWPGGPAGTDECARYDGHGPYATRDYVGGTDTFLVGDGAGGTLLLYFDRGLFIRREVPGGPEPGPGGFAGGGVGPMIGVGGPEIEGRIL